MINIDMWYGDNHKEADKIDIIFYPNEGKYRGNIFKNGKYIGDYVCDDSVELENTFSQVTNHQPCWWFAVGPTGSMLLFRLKAVRQTIILLLFRLKVVQ